MALLTSIKNKEYRTSSKHFKEVDTLLLYDIIRLDGVIKLDEDEMTFELKDDQLIIHIQKLFPTLKIVGINLDAYEKYNFPKNIKFVPNKIQNLINVAFYNDIGKKPADKIDGYTFIYDSNPDDLLVRFGTMPGSNIYTNCKFDIKGRFGFLFITLPEDRNKERPFLISTSNSFRPGETYLNTDYINLSKMVFNGTNKFEKTYDNKLYLYFYRIHLDLFYARNVGGVVDDGMVNNIREFVNAQLNPNKKYTKMMIIPTALDWSDRK
uniref:Uncharacterized protein n=1 Tax=Ackermannviridae sp. TaxID=2831612 RepID=A0A8S5RUX1_9CAUD|nr:MAG TPA: hypothetical protein [Ackermannviridae sp.]